MKHDFLCPYCSTKLLKIHSKTNSISKASFYYLQCPTCQVKLKSAISLTPENSPRERQRSALFMALRAHLAQFKYKDLDFRNIKSKLTAEALKFIASNYKNSKRSEKLELDEIINLAVTETINGNFTIELSMCTPSEIFIKNRLTGAGFFVGAGTLAQKIKAKGAKL